MALEFHLHIREEGSSQGRDVLSPGNEGKETGKGGEKEEQWEERQVSGRRREQGKV